MPIALGTVSDYVFDIGLLAPGTTILFELPELRRDARYGRPPVLVSAVASYNAQASGILSIYGYMNGRFVQSVPYSGSVAWNAVTDKYVNLVAAIPAGEACYVFARNPGTTAYPAGARLFASIIPL